MIPRRLSDLGRDDIEQLIQESVSESRTLDYKEELPGNSDQQKKDFLADVSAFANTRGGDLIFGVPRSALKVSQRAYLSKPQALAVGPRWKGRVWSKFCSGGGASTTLPH